MICAMAQKTILRIIDDFDGTELGDVDKPTVSFSLDGVDYEIDLSEQHQEELRETLRRYTEAARRTTSRGRTKTGSRPSTAGGPPAAEIRAWARSHGFEVPDRGRIPAEAREAFNAAH